MVPMTSVSDDIEDADDSPAARRWRLDKRVPIALIVTLVLQAGAAVWWAAKLDSRIGVVETWTRDNAGTPARLSAIESKVDLLLAKRQQASLGHQ
jgi:hypothetical protein